MKLYHGSTTLFDAPSNSAFKEGFANSEYGVGFNTTDYIGLASEYAHIATNGPGAIYEYEFDETRLASWVVQGQPIGAALHGRIIDKLHLIEDSWAQDVREQLTPETDGLDAFALLRGRQREGCDFMMKCGIEGANTNNYFVFFSSRFVPQQTINRVLGDFPAAHEALARQQQTGILSVDQPVKADGTIMGPRNHYLSDELARAAHDIHKTGDKKLITLFETGIAAPLLSGDWTNPGGHGFSVRNNMGLAFQRLLDDGGITLSDHWSGANTLDRTLGWMQNDVAGTDPLIEKAQEIAAIIRARHAPASHIG